MKGKLTHAQAQVPGKKQNKKAKGKPKVQNEPRKAIQKSKMNKGESEKQAFSQSPTSSDSELNSEVQKAEPHLKTNPNVKVSTLEEAKIQTKNLNENKNEDKKQKLPEDKPHTEQAPAVIPNVGKPKPPDSSNNGHKSREPDKKDSGSEDGLITPKKRKAKHRANKNLNIMKFKMIPSTSRDPILDEGLDNLKLHCGDQKGIKVESPKSERLAVGAGRGRSGPGYTQEKAFNKSPGPNSQKVDQRSTIVPTALAVPEEEAWSPFKQTTVFSISSSNVPKVTYASKVKQNLPKVESPTTSLRSCQQSELSPESAATLYLSSAMTGSPILMVSHELTQVSISPLKSVNSLDSVNASDKSMNAQSSQTLPLEARLIRRPSCSPKSVIHKMKPSCPSAQPNFFPYPSYMPVALRGLKANITRPQTEVQMLEEIFQNEWGLSFITELSIGPEFTEEIAPEPKVIQPHKCPSPLALQETSKSPCVPQCVVKPKVYNMSKWLNPQGFEDIKPPAPVQEREALILYPSLGDEQLQQATPKSHEAFVPLLSNYKLKNSEHLPTNPSPDSTLKDSEQKNDWEPLNFRAVVEYHMAEMQSVLDMQKQDPQRVIIYDESMDS
ncbi:FMR1-interacting protein NUFIP2-like [Petaurus breviceps papuanus]|uniref:FMR1-interacting protein NUFIP2-like n=1 Tax=Petaurus breviceps papuanus TaxID=3040969 RepID=UPI0036DAF832